jgi:outer membrane protein OmpA-like peptidoglycan-associated protein
MLHGEASEQKERQMRRLQGSFGALLLAMAILSVSTPAQAQFGHLKDKLKQKAEEKVGKKTDEAVDKAVDGSGNKDATPAETPAEGGEAPAEGNAPAAPGPKGGTATAEDMSMVTKFDFIPGDKVIFYDDLSTEEMGEFPSRWKLDNGVFEIVKKGARNWILCSDRGSIRPKVASGPLPPKYTFEVDILEKKTESWGDGYTIQWLDAKDDVIGEFYIGNRTGTVVKMNGKEYASKAIADVPVGIVRTMRIMATKTTMKCYIDHERVANIPAIEGFQPVGFRLYVEPGNANAPNPQLFGNIRYAEGGKTMKEQLDEAGRIVTHGILFDSGSDKIKAESYKTLADIGGLLTGSPELRLSIEGHTDSDGAEAANLELSQKRANAVRTYLVDSYKIDAGRLEAKGWGEGKPIDTNDTAEGKANNRRVELVKL